VAGALEEDDRLEQVRVDVTGGGLDLGAPTLDSPCRREHAARALLVEHVAMAGGRAPDELVLAIGRPRERVGLARVNRHRSEAGRVVSARQDEARQRRPGGGDEDEQEQGGSAKHPRKGGKRAY